MRDRELVFLELGERVWWKFQTKPRDERWLKTLDWRGYARLSR